MAGRRRDRAAGSDDRGRKRDRRGQRSDKIHSRKCGGGRESMQDHTEDQPRLSAITALTP